MTTVLTVALLLITVPAQAYYNHYTHYQKRTCRFERNHRWSHTETIDTYQCVYNKIDPNDKGIAGYIGERESHFNAYAYNKSSGASGVYQFLKSTFKHDYHAFRNK